MNGRVLPELTLIAVLMATATACERPLSRDAELGRQAVRDHDCGACHRIPGVPGAEGQVGPPLNEYGRRVYVAGVLPNDRENLARWLQDPATFRPRTAMPDLDIDAQTARRMAAFLLDDQ